MAIKVLEFNLVEMSQRIDFSRRTKEPVVGGGDFMQARRRQVALLAIADCTELFVKDLRNALSRPTLEQVTNLTQPADQIHNRDQRIRSLLLAFDPDQPRMHIPKLVVQIAAEGVEVKRHRFRR